MIIIPMAGRSSRFSEAGYSVPKYRLEVYGTPVFDLVVASFRDYFETESFLFITRDETNTVEFVESRLKRFSLNYQIVSLKEESRGQADTVYKGLCKSQISENEPITIFNIDTIRPQCKIPWDTGSIGAGYLEVFKGIGDSWSFVAPNEERQGVALKVIEKVRISDLCSTGLYYFHSKAIFDEAFKAELRRLKGEKSELYVAPLYNHLITQGLEVTYKEISAEDIILCGVPKEYEALLRDSDFSTKLKKRLDLI